MCAGSNTTAQWVPSGRVVRPEKVPFSNAVPIAGRVETVRVDVVVVMVYYQ